VEDNAEFTCLQVTAVERLLHETLASACWNILCPIQFRLKKERKTCMCAYAFI
jgi:hypothetical protein